MPRARAQVVRARAISVANELSARARRRLRAAGHQAAYGLTGTAATNGAGQTIALIEAFRDPAAASDLATYRRNFALPACTVASGCFRQVDLSGGSSRADAGWEQETSLDMDAVSAACPLCHILVVESIDDSDPNLIAAVQRAVSLGATVVNLSFGGCEGGGGTYDTTFHQARVPITAATGDNGFFALDNGGCQYGTPEYPASSPYVTAVGGTNLARGGGGSRGWTETVWQYAFSQLYGAQAGGSGCSSFETKPSWQTDAGCAHRTVSDVSADADPRSGLSVYVSDPAAGGGWNVFGGTSLAAPLIAGMYALAGAPQAALDGHIWYMGAAVNDITSGSNAALPSDCNPAYLCNARPGFDGPTGVGTPNGPPAVDPTFNAPPSQFSPQGVGQPAVTVAPDGTQLIFWQGAGGHLMEAWWKGSWNGPVDWTAANGWAASLSSAPSVALAPDGTQVVFWESSTGHLIEAWWNGHWNGPVDWTAANGWGSPLTSAPSVRFAPDGTQLIFWQGAGGHLDEVWWNGHWNGPVDWTAANGWGSPLASAPSVALAPDGTQIIFWQGAGGHLMEAWWKGKWNGPVDWTAAYGWSPSLTSAPSVTFAPDGTQLIFWKTASGHLDEVWWNGHWNGPVDWTAANGWGPSMTSAPSVTIAADGTQQIYWQGGGGHLIEVWWQGRWNGPVDWSS